MMVSSRGSATLAQLVERHFCKVDVVSSILTGGSKTWIFSVYNRRMKKIVSVIASLCAFSVLFNNLPMIMKSVFANPAYLLTNWHIGIEVLMPIMLSICVLVAVWIFFKDPSISNRASHLFLILYAIISLDWIFRDSSAADFACLLQKSCYQGSPILLFNHFVFQYSTYLQIVLLLIFILGVSISFRKK
jgi:hypothetical protein